MEGHDRYTPLWAATLLTIFAGALDLAASFSYYLYEASTVILGITLTITLFKRYGLHPINIAKGVVGRLTAGRLWAIALLLYLFWELIGLAYSPASRLAFAKYPAVLVMLVLAMSMLLCIESHRRIDQALLAIALAAGAAAVLAVFSYFFPVLYPVQYTLRLTLRRDYNVFATTLLIGCCCGLFLLIQAPLKRWVRCLAIGGVGLLFTTVVLLSGSRRVVLLLYPALGVTILVWLLRELSYRKDQARAGGTVAATVLVAGLAVAVAVTQISGYMQQVYATHGELGVSSGSGGSTTLQERYDTITDSSMLEKRLIIWDIALQELKSYSPTQLLAGKGTGYNIHLYDLTPDDRLHQLYGPDRDITGAMSAHNFVLADLLEGGLVRLVLGLLMLVPLLSCGWAVLLHQPANAFMYVIVWAVILVNNLISNRYGLLYDKFFWIFSVLLIKETQRIMQADRRIGVRR